MAATVRNTAIRRIQGDVREMMTNPSDQYAAAPLETNMFDWHFTLRGPRGTEFEGGVYHGRIILPSDYPFKPPNIMLLTPNGRFEVKKKICLSISAYHPEEWQPAWGVRLILEALISFMPTKGEGAIGALDFSADERKRLAKLSVDYKCDTCGRVVDLLPELDSSSEKEKKPSKYTEQIAQLHIHNLESAPSSSAAADGKKTADATAMERASSSTVATDGNETAHTAAVAAEHGLKDAKTAPHNSAETHEKAAVNSKPASTAEDSATDVSNITDASDSASAQATVSDLAEEAVAETETPAVTEPHRTVDTPIEAQGIAQVRESDSVDTLLHYLTIAIVVALFALIYKKLLQMHGLLQ